MRHQSVFEEPLGSTGVLSLPPNQVRLPCFLGREARTISLEGARAPQLQTIGQERGSGVEVGSHHQAGHVASDVLVVE